MLVNLLVKVVNLLAQVQIVVFHHLPQVEIVEVEVAHQMDKLPLVQNQHLPFGIIYKIALQSYFQILKM